MTLLPWLLGGLAIGIVVELLVGGRSTAAADAEATGGAQRRRLRPRRVLAWTAIAVVIAIVGLVAGGYLWARAVFDRIETVPVSAQLSSSGGGTNYLLVGSDNGRTDAEAREGIEGARSDTIMVLRIEGDEALMLSLNRDLWVANPATGQNGRINATYNDGPANLVQAVTENFAIPIHRYIEIDFISFAGLVDAVGGIEIDFPHPALDRGSGLVVEEAGLVRLDGDQALAYVRSRGYREIIDGQEVAQPGLPDVNRTERQQIFLRTVMAEVGASRNPVGLMRIADQMAEGLRIDDDMTMVDAARFAWRMGRLDPETVVLPVVPRTTTGGAAVLDLDLPAAEEVLQRFR